jgi:hypothetical protein
VISLIKKNSTYFKKASLIHLTENAVRARNNLNKRSKAITIVKFVAMHLEVVTL